MLTGLQLCLHPVAQCGSCDRPEDCDHRRDDADHHPSLPAKSRSALQDEKGFGLSSNYVSAFQRGHARAFLSEGTAPNSPWLFTTEFPLLDGGAP
jgi:hypothetical protein